MTTYDTLPDDLPVPEDDGAAEHLPGMTLPPLTLAATEGGAVDLSALGQGRTVLYLYAWSLVMAGLAPPSTRMRKHRWMRE